ncbi:MAG: glycosyltransferase family 2 protein [PVC group bacterium]|nr:glycosyltransferase family 2 protein [PVC group bacterium]
MYPKVAIIILNWNGKQDSLKCLYSIRQLKYPNYEVIFVDNGSTDGSVSCISENFPDIEIIQNKTNLGFSEGNNVGMRYALKNGADYIFLLNNDTMVDSFVLDHLVAEGEKNAQIGILGPKMYHLELHPGYLYSIGGKINFREYVIESLACNNKDDGQYDHIREVDFIIGCGLLIKKKVIDEIGLLDPVYFSYFEDVDWCVRARAKGYKIIHVPEAKIWHSVAASTGGDRNPRWYYLMGRGSAVFVRKNASLCNLIKFICFIVAEFLWVVMKKILFGYKKPIFAKMRGLRDGLLLREVNTQNLEWK